MQIDPKPVSQRLLRRYFYSGWAFFIPYLFFYLLYYWRKWPVNPGTGSHLPPLLHVYWTLHAINVMLGLLALRAWWRNSAAATLNAQRSTLPVLRSPSEGGRPLATDLWPLASRLLPWLLLALIFYIPGAYLEWPSDPWEHLHRINEWMWLQTVGEHSVWYRSSYFLGYSLLGQISPPSRQLFWLDVYYTGACLLLCWQYYRLAQAAGLDKRAAMIFVLLQTLLLGNSVFGFYRYYGISSSIYAQFGAIALIRLGIEFAQQLPTGAVRWLEALGCTALLALLTAFNHLQGIGIAALGLAAAAGWQLVKRKRSMIWWLAAATLALNIAALLFLHRDPALDTSYRPAGWLTALHGFNILSPSSPAFDRAMQILGFFGIVNLAAGLVLLCRNHVVGWLTVLPALSLCLPCLAIPFANILARHYSTDSGIITFHRMLFSIPPGLAVVTLIDLAIRAKEEKTKGADQRAGILHAADFWAFCSLPGVLLAFALMPANGPIYYNRFWNAFMIPADDLAMRHVIADSKELPFQKFHGVARLLTTPGLGYVLQSTGARNVFYIEHRTLIPPAYPSARANLLVHFVTVGPQDRVTGLLLVPPVQLLTTPSSLAARLSGHWFPNEDALNYTGGREAEIAARNIGGKRLVGDQATFYLFAP